MKMHKTAPALINIILIGLLLLISGQNTASAETSIRVFVDDRELACDVPPQAQNGRLLVPLRALGEALGFEAQWDGANQTAILEREDTLISLTAGSLWASVNGSLVEIETPMQIVNSRVLAPLRFISESFDCTAEWRGDVQEVRIYTDSTAMLASSEIKYITYCNLNDQTTPYQVDYPQDYVKSTVSPREITFVSPDGLATLAIIDAGNDGRQNISQCYADEYGLHKDSTIYQHLKSDEKWYVLAWTEDGETTYSKTFYCGDTIVSARFSFPAEQDKYYQGIIEHFLQSFIVELKVE